MRKSSSHAGFNNRNQARRGWQMEVEWEEKKLDEEVKHRSPYSRLPLTSFPHPSSPISFRYSFALRNCHPRTRLTSTSPSSWSYLYQQPSVFRYSVSRFDATRLSTYVSPRVSLRPSLLEYSSHVFSFFPFFSFYCFASVCSQYSR